MWDWERKPSNLRWDDGKGGECRELGVHFIEVLEVSFVRLTERSTHYRVSGRMTEGGRREGGREGEGERGEGRRGKAVRGNAKHTNMSQD